MSRLGDELGLIKAIASNPQSIRVKPSVNLFLMQYLRKFQVKSVGGHLVLHSHLPPMNSRAYGRFIDEHLLAKSDGPSHAQIGLTNACPQDCEYCYNKHKTGRTMDTETIKGVIQDLKAMGVFWLGFTGGEPLLNKDIVEITESVGRDCAVKLFTTGCTLTRQKALDLKKAGLFSASVSLDSWREDEHDRVRRYKGAFQTALRAIETFKEVGLHTGVSAVLSRDMIQRGEVEVFLRFLIGLGVHEAWLSETKPSVEALWKPEVVISDAERRGLIELQDRYNNAGKITVNYLGHFESEEHFGCNAGHKMVYVDAFGNVSPCVFTPMTFGNVMERSVRDIVDEMHRCFPSENRCFVNKNYALLQKHYQGASPISREETLRLMREVEFGPMAKFFELHYGGGQTNEVACFKPSPVKV